MDGEWGEKTMIKTQISSLFVLFVAKAKVSFLAIVCSRPYN